MHNQQFMNHQQKVNVLRNRKQFEPAAVLCLVLFFVARMAAPLTAEAATIWDGPTMSYTQPEPDFTQLTPQPSLT